MPGIGLVIVALAIGMFCALPKPKVYQHWFWPRVGRALAATFFALAFGNIFGIRFIEYSHKEDFTEEVTRVQPIVNIHDSMQFSGSGFLFVTTINGGPAYAYYVENVPGDLEQRYMDTYGVVIREVPGKTTGELKTYETIYRPVSWARYWVKSSIVKDAPRYVFEVPQGTVRRGFQLGE